MRSNRFFRHLLQPRVLAPFLMTIAWAAAVLLLPHTFWLQLLSTAFLLLVPGYTLYRAIVGYPYNESKTVALSFVVGLSVTSLMVIGLSLNQLLLWRGISQQPLTTTNLTIAVAAFTLLCTLATALRQLPRRFKHPNRSLSLVFWRGRGRAFWLTIVGSGLLLLLPLLAIGGATMLNNGGSDWLALSVVGLVGLVLFALLWTDKKHWLALYPLALYVAALALLLGTSMRGWDITGHDVMQEFQVFQLTSSHSQWNMGYYQDAYTACLSITVLPTLLQRLTGIYDPYVFKLVFQVVFALIVPLLYAALRVKVQRKVAFLAALVFMTFPTFLTDMMMLNRQEIAMLCFTLAIVAGMSTYLKSRQRHLLLIIFFGGMVLAHYSTSYITISILLVATSLGIGMKLLQRVERMKRFELHRQSPFAIVPPYIVVLVLLMIVGWSGLATNTAGNISQTITTIGADITKLVTHTATTPPQSGRVDPYATDFEKYEASTRQARPLPDKEYYPDVIVDESSPPEVVQQPADVAPWLTALHVSSAVLSKIYDVTRQVYIGLLALLMAVGLCVLVLKHHVSKLPAQYTILGVASLLVVVLQVVLPSDAVNYGLARVIQQGLIVLALPTALGFVWLLGVLKIKSWRIKPTWRFRVVAIGVVIGFFILTSFASTITGGYKPALAFSNAGFYYQAYYTHRDEIEADQWLLSDTPKGSRVYADEFARRQMITYAGIFPDPTLLPAAIPIDSYVYLSHSDTMFSEVPVYYKSSLLFYSVPTYFLNEQKDLLYNAGRVLIYK